jgi:hypothetical protein
LRTSIVSAREDGRGGRGDVHKRAGHSSPGLRFIQKLIEASPPGL